MYAIVTGFVIITILCYKICKPINTTTTPESYIKWSDIWVASHSTINNTPEAIGSR